ncbi:MAG: retroviral-like aspartic protease family protein [Lachnospiraceae bacterium]|jgi:predicted aspartyl protease|nr:retroviral-like aspartic protease family protein [Lachnospiraceae bacterium]
MQAINIHFEPHGLGRVEFDAEVSTGDKKSLHKIAFKLDSGSDFTTLSCDDLKKLGYTEEYLQNRPTHVNKASGATEEITLRFIEGVSIKFGERELQGCKVFFALGTELRSLFGSDILKYFNWEVDNDEGELRLTQRETLPELSEGEVPIQIYAVAKV